MKDRVTKFEKFIQENEAKRRRAIQKYQTEVKLKEQKTDEYEQLCLQLEELKQRSVLSKSVVYKSFAWLFYLESLLIAHMRARFYTDSVTHLIKISHMS